MNVKLLGIPSMCLFGVLVALVEAHPTYSSVGCFIDKRLRRRRAIPYSGHTFRGSSAVQKCADYAAARGFKVFGVQYGGECYSGPRAHETYSKYGQAEKSDCKNGLGGRLRNSVYTVTPLPCGKRPMGRIVGGEDAPKNSWPWQAMIVDSDNDQFCAGSLLSNEWVVTAAHCVYGRVHRKIKVRLGAHKLKGDTSRTVQDFKVAKVIPNPGFDYPNTPDDIALIKLDKRAVFDESVRTVCLPDRIITAGMKCWITGWGNMLPFPDMMTSTKQPDVLQQAEISVVPWEKCDEQEWGKLDYSRMCAGSEKPGKDICLGDSGGPLVCEHHAKWHLAGVTSYTHGCAHPDGIYSVFANVTYLQPWLEETMRNN